MTCSRSPLSTGVSSDLSLTTLPSWFCAMIAARTSPSCSALAARRWRSCSMRLILSSSVAPRCSPRAVAATTMACPMCFLWRATASFDSPNSRPMLRTEARLTMATSISVRRSLAQAVYFLAAIEALPPELHELADLAIVDVDAQVDVLEPRDDVGELRQLFLFHRLAPGPNLTLALGL